MTSHETSPAIPTKEQTGVLFLQFSHTGWPAGEQSNSGKVIGNRRVKPIVRKTQGKLGNYCIAAIDKKFPKEYD